MAGIAGEINVMVWMFGLGGIGMLMTTVASMIMWYGYDEAYTWSVSDDASATEQGVAPFLMDYIQTDIMRWTIDSVVVDLGLAMHAKTWMKNNMEKSGKNGKGGKGGKMDQNGKDGKMNKDGKMAGPKPEGDMSAPAMEFAEMIVNMIAF